MTLNPFIAFILVRLILAWVSTVAGNFTLAGSAANIIVAEKAFRHGNKRANEEQSKNNGGNERPTEQQRPSRAIPAEVID